MTSDNSFPIIGRLVDEAHEEALEEVTIIQHTTKEEQSCLKRLYPDKAIQYICPVTPMQAAMLSAIEHAPGQNSYLVSNWVELPESFDPDLLRERACLVVQRHETLRTAFVTPGNTAGQCSTPLQVVLQNREASFECEDIRSLSSEQQEEYLERFNQKVTGADFNLQRSPMLQLFVFRLGDNQYRLLLMWHHLVLDEWSFALVLKELLSPLPPQNPPISFRHHLGWLARQNKDKHLEWWKQTLDECAAVSLQLAGTAAADAAERRSNLFSFSLDQQTEKRLRKLSSRHELTVNCLLQAAWGIVLSRYSNQEDVLFGTVVSGRPSHLENVEHLVGRCANTVPMHIHCTEDFSFITLANAVQRHLLSASDHCCCSTAELDAVAGTTFADIIFVMENRPSAGKDESVVTPASAVYMDVPLAVEWQDAGHLSCSFHLCMAHEEWRVVALRDHYLTLIKRLTQSPDAPLRDISMLSPKEMRQILKFSQGKDTLSSLPPESLPDTVLNMFRFCSEHWPDNIAVDDGKSTYTYSELYGLCQNIARGLNAKGIGADNIVGISLPRSADFVVAAMSVFFAGAAYLPIDPAGPTERARFMLEDAKVALLIHSEGAAYATLDAPSVTEQASFAQSASTLSELAEIGRKQAEQPSPLVGPADLAYVIYTSGSTGQPKGVQIEHRSLVNFCRWQHRILSATETDVFSTYAPIIFDASVLEIFPALTCGATVQVVPDPIRTDLQALVHFFTERRITVSFLTPAVAKELLRDAHLLPHLRVLGTGGEKSGALSPQPFTMINDYGPTEFTVCATAWVVNEHRELPPIGTPVDNTRCYILGRNGQLQPLGVPGELHVSGVQIARGYINRPEQTADAFVTNPFASGNPGFERMYRTGDICRLMPDGNIEYLGRADDQIKIRGHRIELGEIEQAIHAHPNVKEAIILAQKVQDRILAEEVTESEERNRGDAPYTLCAYIVTENGGTMEHGELSGWLETRLPHWMHPSFVLTLPVMPLTVNGKIDKKALPLPDLTAADTSLPTTPEEKIVYDIWKDLLQVPQPGLRESFFMLGGDSIKAMRIASQLHRLGFTVNTQDVFRCNTIEMLAAFMAEIGRSEHETREEYDITPDIAPEERDYLQNLYQEEIIQHICPVTPMQESMLFAIEHEPDQNPYVISNWLELRDTFGPALLRQQVELVVQRHEALRTAFVTPGNSAGLCSIPLQVVLQKREARFEFEDIRFLSSEQQVNYLESFNQKAMGVRFDLQHSPMLQFFLFQLDQNLYRLMIVWHHLVLDGWSLALFFNELFSPVPPQAPPVSFRHHLEWLTRQNKEQHLEWWKHTLDECAAATLQLADTATANAQERKSSQFTSTSFTLDQQTETCLRKLSSDHRLTVNSLLQAAWGIVLSRYSNQDDVLFGTVVSGRPSSLENVEQLVGLCINTVPMRIHCTEDISFLALAGAVQSHLLNASDYCCCSTSELNAVAGTTFTDILFVMENQPGVQGNDNIVALGNSARMDVPFAVEWQDAGSLSCTFHVGMAHEEWRVAALRDHYATLIERLAKLPDAPLRDISMLTPEEMWRILEYSQGRDTLIALPHEALSDTVLNMFGLCCKHWPDNTAVSDETMSYTYSELYGLCRSIARGLNAKGVGKGDIAGIYLPRSASFVVAALSVLFAGAAYLPIDPAGPAERARFMLEDAQAAMLIHNEGATDTSPEAVSATDLAASLAYGASTLRELAVIGLKHPKKSLPSVTPDDLAYVIYTSGSTGQPKGVQIGHQGIANLCRWQHRSFPTSEADVFSAYAPVIFDASVYEIFPALTCGAAISIVPDAIRTDLEPLARFFTEQRISVAFLPPIVGKELMREASLPHLRVLTLAGDKPGALTPQPFTLLNGYGPSEFTVCVTVWSVNEDKELPPIGTPIDNTRCYVLGRNGQLQPFGVPGELHVSGVQIAKGYINRPEQTAAAFVVNPFADGNPHYERMYRSGDVCSLMQDGNFIFLGRDDDQIKVRGHRVELGEIEQAIHAHPNVRETVVIAQKIQSDAHAEAGTEDHDGADDNSVLCAYLVTENGGTMEHGELTDWLAARLPYWMQPSFVMTLPSMPLTVNGKIDKTALPLPDRTSADASLPTTAEEQMVYDIWKDLLNVPQPGLRDSFFMLGGDSIKAMRTASQLHKLGFSVSTQDIFRCNTIESLAAFLTEIGTSTNELQEEYDVTPDIASEEHAYLQKLYLKENIQHICPVTPLQEVMLFAIEHAPDQNLYLINNWMELHDSIDPNRLHERYKLMMQRHDALRTAFITPGNSAGQCSIPLQVVLQEREAHFEFEDIRSLSAQEQEAYLEHFNQKIMGTGFDLQHSPMVQVFLFHLGDNLYRLMIMWHHLVLDGWSLALIFQELLSSLQPHDAPVSFRRHVEWFARQNKEEHFGWWKQALDDCATATTLQLADTTTANTVETDNNGTSLSFTLDEHIEKQLRNLSFKHKLTLNSLLQAAWGIVLSRYNNQDDVLFGTVVSGRPSTIENVEQLVGLCINNVPMRMRCKDDLSFIQLANAVQSHLLSASDYCCCTTAELNAVAGTTFTDILFVLQNQPTTGIDNINAVDVSGSGMVDVPFAVEWHDTGSLSCSFLINIAHEEWRIAALRDHYVTLIARLALAPDAPLSDISMLTPEETQHILRCSQGENTLVDLSPDSLSDTVLDLFSLCAERWPDNTALADEINSYTYKEFGNTCQNIARGLNAKGIGAGDIVGINLPRSADFVVAAMSVFFTGAAYLPIDPTSPAERARFMLEDAKVALLIHSEDAMQASLDTISVTELASLLTQGANTLNELAEIGRKQSKKPLPSVTPADLAYVIYTSGSTGQPKGTQIEHQALVNLCRWQHRILPASETDVFSTYAPIIFDASVLEIFPALTCGAKVQVVPDPIRTDLQTLARFFTEQRVTITFLTTAVARELLRDAHLLPHQRVLSLGGEKLNELGPQRFKVMHVYGPTECTALSTAWLAEEQRLDPPIGIPADNLSCYIVGKNGQLQPFGVPGELHISGAQLARGYLNRPEQTAAAFVANPFANGKPGYEHMYRSGDICRLMPDGNIVFLGRADDQIKIRGHRVELGEIEQAIHTHPNVRETIVLAQKLHDKIQSEEHGRRDDPYTLCAYVVTRDGEAMAQEKLSGWLATRLPHWMQPAFVMTLPSMPLTVNGKIDKRALPLPDLTSADATLPTTAEEQIVYDIWKDLLNVSQPGLRESFFLLGGDSIKAMRIASQLHRLGFSVTTQDVFRCNTIEALAAFMAEIGRSENEIQEEYDITPVLAPEEHDYLQALYQEEIIQYICPVTPMQESMLFAIEHDPDQNPYLISNWIELREPFGPDLLGKQIELEVQRHEALRTAFVTPGNSAGQCSMPLQVVLQKREARFEFEDIRFLSSEQQEEYLAHFAQKTLGERFYLQHTPMLQFYLFQQGDTLYRMLILWHHIVLDGWSLALFLSELLSPVPPQGPPVSFRHHLGWLARQNKEKHLEWWRQALDECVAVSLPLTDTATANIQARRSNQFTSTAFTLDQETVKRLRKLSSDHKLTVNSFLQAAWGIILSRYSNQEDLLFGTVVSGRPSSLQNVEQLVGLCINTVPMRMYCTEDLSFATLAGAVQSHLLNASDYCCCSTAELNAVAGTTFTDILFVMENQPSVHGDDSIVTLGGTVRMDVPLVVEWQDAGRLSCTLHVSMAHEEWRVAALRDHYATLIERLAESPDVSVRDISMLTPEEIRRILECSQGKDTFIDLPPEALPHTLLNMFDFCCKHWPFNTAVSDNNRSYTYSELHGLCRSIARGLNAKGIGKGDIAGIYLPRSADYVVDRKSTRLNSSH